MDTEDLQVAMADTLPNDDYKDLNKSAPVDKNATIIKDAETEAPENTKANTTVIKSIAMLNATVMASVWSLADRIPRTIVTASVVAILWRKTKPY